MRSICLLVALLAAGSARADQARHEFSAARMKPIKEAGKVVGVKLPVIVRPGGASRGTPKRVFIGLGAATKQGFTRPNDDAYRIVHDEGYGYLRWKSPWTDLAGGSAPLELELEVRYGKGNQLKGGDRVDLFSVWQIPPNQWHLWGSVFYYEGNADVLTLPE